MNAHLDFTFPYASARPAVFGRSAIATSHSLASMAGMEMLLAGGTAVDAAVAAALTLTVVEPTGCGIGSDAFAIVWDGKELHGLDASGRAPAAWTPEYFAGRKDMPRRGWDTVTVPGAVSGWTALLDRFGKLPFTQVALPAIRHARQGFAVTPIVAKRWAASVDILADKPGFADCFLPGGRAPRAGEIFHAPAHADTLEEIAYSNGDSFYRGRLAQEIARHAAAHGGALCLADLAEHRADWVHTLAQPYAGAVVHELPPAGQGIATLIGLGILSAIGGGAPGVDSIEEVHRSIEATKLGLADLYQFVGAPEAMAVTAEALLDPSYLADRARLIDPDRAGDPGHGAPRPAGTVCLSAADSNGMMISFIQSNYNGFGSGIVIPGTGISLQNRGAGFSLSKDHPNCVAPRKRPFHTIIPGFAMASDGQPLMAFGLMGGPMQAQGHLQLMQRMLKYRQNPQAAADAPRWRIISGRKIAVEPGMDPGLLSALAAKGHEIVQGEQDHDFAFGGAQIVMRHGEGYIAGSDPRKDGLALAS
ncbi:MAG: gamma-glutamyltransferase family protein [Blastomonas sp.]